MQLWAVLFFINNCKFTTCFGRFLRPSSGVLKTLVFSTPDDGRRKRLKHVVNLQLLIKTILPKVASGWFFICFPLNFVK